MNKLTLDAIRTRSLRAKQNPLCYAYASHEPYEEDIAFLLDCVDAETARADANRDEAKLIDLNSADKDKEIERINAELSIWKTRAQALENMARGYCLGCVKAEEAKIKNGASKFPDMVWWEHFAPNLLGANGDRKRNCEHWEFAEMRWLPSVLESG